LEQRPYRRAWAAVDPFPGRRTLATVTFLRRLRWWEVLPEVVLGLGLAFFAATEPSAAGSAFRSTRAILLMVVVAVAWLAGRILLVRSTQWPALRLGLFGVAAVAVLAVVVLPSYDDTTVVEALPMAAEAPVTTTPPPPTEPVSGPSSTVASTTTSTVLPQPVALRSSPIHGIDHRASGTAVVYQQPDASLVVGLEAIDIQPGPDYDVYVVPGADQESVDGGVRLDDLRGNKGTQYYAVPPGTDVAEGPWTVLVWCVTFDVPVAGATPV